MLPTLLMALAPAWAQIAHKPTPVIIDRVVVVVGKRVITSSDLQLSLALQERDISPEPVLADEPGDPLQRLIDITILRELAGEVQVYQPTDGEVRGRMEAMRATWEDPAQYRRFLRIHGLDEERLRRVITERLIVEEYIRRNLTAASGSQAPVGPKTRFAKWMSLLRSDVRVRRVTPQNVP